MEKIFAEFISITLWASAAIAAVMLLRCLFSKKISAGFFRLAWLVLAVRLVLPFNISLPVPKTTVQVPVMLYTESFVNNKDELKAPQKETYATNQESADSKEASAAAKKANSAVNISGPPKGINLQKTLPVIWLSGTAVYLFVFMLSYLIYAHKLKKRRRPLGGYALCSLPIYISDAAAEPLLCGFLKPAIYLPNRTYPPDALQSIINHELIHYKRCDLWAKLLLLCASAVSWFNPIVYLMRNIAMCDIEMAVDEKLLKDAAPTIRQEYGRLLFAEITRQKGNSMLTANYSGKSFKNRISAILSTGRKSKGRTIMACLLCFCTLASFFIGGSFNVYAYELQNRAYKQSNRVPEYTVKLSRYDNISKTSAMQRYTAEQYNKNDIITFSFHTNTVLEGAEELQKAVVEYGKNPGLGIRGLHKSGVTGKGVRVAVIAYKSPLNNTEYSDKIVNEATAGAESLKLKGTLSASAQISILAGETIGVAPGAQVYFAAVQNQSSSEDYANALYGIIAENENSLPENKIRVVVISGADLSLKQQKANYKNAVQAANNAGIYVIDGRRNPLTYAFSPAYSTLQSPENPADYAGGYPQNPAPITETKLGVPCAYRTYTDEIYTEQGAYNYIGKGSDDLIAPYVAGVMALGWQINPELTYEQMLEILFNTAAQGIDGSNIINPAAFIAALKNGV